jgi:hypothetical protein
MTGAVTLSANIGNLGWTRTTVTGGSSTSFMPTGSFPDMGGIEIVTPATSGDGQSWALTQGIPGLLGTTNDIWFLKLRFQQPQGTTDSTNGEIFQIGVTASGGLSSTNSAGFAALQLDIDTTITRGSWWVGPCSGSACILDNYASVDNNWHTLQIFSLTAGNISFQLDSSAAVCFTAASSGPCNGITGSNVTYNAGTYLPSTSAVLLPFVKDVAESSTAVKAIQGRWAFEIKDLTGTGLP